MKRTILTALAALAVTTAAHAGDFQLHPTDDRGLLYTGAVESGDAATLMDILLTFGSEFDTIYLLSPGGVAAEGILLASTIREFGMNTVSVESACYSACAMAWLGGIERYGVTWHHGAYNPATYEVSIDFTVRAYDYLGCIPAVAEAILLETSPSEFMPFNAEMADEFCPVS